MARRSRQGRGRPRGLAARLLELEQQVATLAARVERMDGGEIRILKAGLFDGRARARPQVGPRCPGCHLVVDIEVERCPFCSCLFSALPPSMRPGPPGKLAARAAARLAAKRSRSGKQSGSRPRRRRA